jgi:dipeptidyl aminopeptidase/acylaminoacyl peptidase
MIPRPARLLPWLLLPAAALAQEAKRDVGNLVIDGVPELPAETIARIDQYQNARQASLVGFDAEDKGILVLTRFGDTNQLHRVAAPGAYREQLTFTREPIASAAVDPATPAGFYYGQDVGGGEFGQFYWFDAKSGRAVLLTDGKSRNDDLLPSRKGGQFAYVSTRRNKKDFDIYVGRRDDPKATRLVKEMEGEWHPLDWSPDDARLLVLREISVNETYLHVLDVASGEMVQVNPRPGVKIAYAAARFAADGAAVFYTSDEDSETLRLVRHDLATGKKTVLTDFKWDVDHLAASRDGKWLAYTVNEGGASAVYLATTAQPAKARRLPVPQGVVSKLAFDRAGKRLAYSLSSTASSSDVYSLDLPAAQKPVRWTFSELAGLAPASFVAPALVEYRTFDGKTIPAWYYKPRATGTRFPVVVVIHGGPEGQSRPSFSALAQYFVNELGVAVLLPNVRGSTGYGKTYTLLDNGFQREDTVKDIGALLDWIGKQPELDPTRVGVYGGSYGGFMVLAALAAFPDRIRCGVDIVGISSFVTFLERTEAYRRDLRRVEYGDERDPKMREFLQKISPLTNAGKIKSPLFVAQGLNDPRVSYKESEQIVDIVRKGGGKVWYVLAKDEGHGFKKKPNRDYFDAATSAFFETYLLR